MASRRNRCLLDAAPTFPAPGTIYREIAKLPPAHVLVAEKGCVTPGSWDLQFTGDENGRREEDYLEELDDLLRESVTLRQISDVPLGAFLSGGIDSTAVVAYMVETSPRPPLTITVGFNNANYDEVAHAQTVAAHLGCEIHTRTVTPDVVIAAAQARVALRRALRGFVSRTGVYVSQAARELVTVALSGDGGDELWAGYARHRVERAEQRAPTVLGPARTAAGWLGHALPLSVKGARALRHLALRPEQAYALKPRTALSSRTRRHASIHATSASASTASIR